MTHAKPCDCPDPVHFDPLTPTEAEAVVQELGDDFFLHRFPEYFDRALKGGLMPEDISEWLAKEVSRAHQRLIERPPLPMRRGASFDEIDGKLKDWD